MARPRKTGLDYFPFDVDFFDNYKIMDLLNEYGALGVSIYQIILCKIYKNGYYLEVPLDKLATQIVRIIGNRWIPKKDLVLQVILYCADIGLFDKALLSQSVITSAGLQQRYSEVTVRNKVNKDKYWLLEKKETQEALITAPKALVSVAETKVNVTETKVNATTIPQKERKGKKSKVNSSSSSLDTNNIVIPCQNGTYTVTEEQQQLLQQVFKNVDVKEALLKMSDYASIRPERQRSLDSVENWIRKWLTENSNGKFQQVNRSSGSDKQQNVKTKEGADNKSSNTSYDISAFKKYDIFE